MHVLILPMFVARAVASCTRGEPTAAWAPRRPKAAFCCDYLKAAPNFQKSQFMENSLRAVLW
jgi:hypothetical protein